MLRRRHLGHGADEKDLLHDNDDGEEEGEAEPQYNVQYVVVDLCEEDEDDVDGCEAQRAQHAHVHHAVLTERTCCEEEEHSHREESVREDDDVDFEDVPVVEFEDGEGLPQVEGHHTVHEEEGEYQ